jgi:hypothetical protein
MKYSNQNPHEIFKAALAEQEARQFELKLGYDPQLTPDESWRFQMLTELGWSDTAALVGAIEKIDWHQAKAYALAGCPPHLAAEILR